MKSSSFVGLGMAFAICNAVFYLCIFYLGASVVTSGIKSFNKECGVTYGVEEVVNGNFFCKK